MKIRHLTFSASSTVLVSCLVFCGGCATDTANSFDSPEDATNALIAALEPEVNLDRLEEVLGSGAKELVDSGDPIYDRQNFDAFVASVNERHVFEEADNGYTYMAIGEDGYPFPIPLYEDEGQWYWDIDEGREELLDRRIGRNELDTIQTCLAIVDAQLEYAILDANGDGIRTYARRFRSSKGKRDGLYWPVKEGDALSPLGEMVVAAAAEGYNTESGMGGVLHGYRFKMLYRQGPDAIGGAFSYEINEQLIGGFGVIAWPATYGNSGLMTFVTNQDGIVFEKDLGPNTEESASAMEEFDPGEGWTRVNETPFDG